MRVEVRLDGAEQSEELEVMEVSVAVGAQVAEGDPLVEVAADKANAELLAPVAGTIVEVRVAVGDLVTPDQVYVVIEAA